MPIPLIDARTSLAENKKFFSIPFNNDMYECDGAWGREREKERKKERKKKREREREKKGEKRISLGTPAKLFTLWTRH